MAIFNCKSCGGDLEIHEGTTVVTCEYCGRQQTVPSMDNEKKINLFNRANRLRSKCDFDRAASVYESIVAEFPQESEAYWGLCLCKFGIEYVDDPGTADKIPTCHRTSYESIFDDQNFDLACENADAIAVNQLRNEAKEIDRLQKEILEIAKNEQPFDVFICYKESDENGARTVDSELAHDIYDVLTEKGYKVFYSRITLKAKLGQDYEPYIFSALNSAKVMLSIGTKYDYFNAVWVKNEWSRFLSLMKSDKSKMLIPCYRDIDPYDMPKEFGGLQGQDLSSPRAFQDLVTNIEKIIPKTVSQPVTPAPIPAVPATEPLIKRAYMCLEDGDWSGADKCCEKILDIDPENYEAYFVKFCIDIKARNIDEIVNSGKTIDEKNTNFQRALKFGNESQKQQLKGINKNILDKIELKKNTELYNSCLEVMKNAVNGSDLYKASDMFKELGGFKDSDELSKQCLEKAAELVNERLYQEAVKLKEKAEDYEASSVYDEAAAAFARISGYRDSVKLAAQCREKAENLDIERRYKSACSMMHDAINEERYLEAQKKFRSFGDYKDSRELAEKCRQEAQRLQEQSKEEAYISALGAIGKNDIPALESALESLNSIKGYKNSEELIPKCEERLRQLKLIAEKTSAANAKRKKRRNTIIAVSSCTAGIAAAVILILAINVFIPQSKYKTAAALEDSGNYDDAIVAFNNLGGYSDAKERAVSCGYKKASELVKAGKYADALNLNIDMGDYREQFYKDICDSIDSIGDYKKSAETYSSLNNLPNSEEKANEFYYKLADEKAAENDYYKAGEIFESISGFSDSAQKANENYYKYACELLEDGHTDSALNYLGKCKDYSDAKQKYNETYYEMAENYYAEKIYTSAGDAYSKIPGYLDSDEKALKSYNNAAEQYFNDGEYNEAFIWWRKAGVEEQKKSEMYDKAINYVDNAKMEEARELFNVLGYYNDSYQYKELCNTWILMHNGQMSLRDAKDKFTELYNNGLDYYGARYMNSPEFSQLNYYVRNYSDQSKLTTNAYVGWMTSSTISHITAAFVISSDCLSLKYMDLAMSVNEGDSSWSSLFLSARNGGEIPIYLDGNKMFVKKDYTLNFSGDKDGRLYLDFGYDNQSNRQTLTVGSIPFYLYSFRHTQYNGGIPMDVSIYDY